ncbi:uncharacterized protein LOC123546691 [Mercenaria mercenaria]|uniref:uncharacterized protein LOC123546691 n=1 Tax=Mercenaria mercenaria TaxID=6596 RepID=UPI00234F1163|nr:uncharacterized protein LOC123546691 [Mercenaria mercenaria]
MTPAGRIRESISSLRSQSAWSPMPEHLLFQQLENDKSPTPVTTDGEKECEECGMKFKTEAMLTYHKIGFCVGPPTEIPPVEISPRTPFQVANESTAMLNNSTKPQSELARHDTTAKQLHTQKQKRLEWCTCANGAVPPSAVKVGFDDSDKTFTYICVAQVGDEVIPGTVLPPRKHATVTLNGEEVKTTEYSVLTDHGGQVSWKKCDVIGGIPRDAVKGGYDSKGLQYFIARGKAPDGNWVGGKYIPEKQQCYFAWEGTEFTGKSFEFLCKNDSKQYFSNINTALKSSNESPIAKPEQTETPAKLTSQEKTRDFKELQPSQTPLSLNKDAPNNSGTPSKSDTDVIEQDTSKLTTKTTRQGTGIIDQEKGKTTRAKEITKPEVMTQGKTKTTAPKEHSNLSTGGITKERNKASNPRELTKSGTAIVSQNKGKANNSRSNTGIRPNSKNLQF